MLLTRAGLPSLPGGLGQGSAALCGPVHLLPSSPQSLPMFQSLGVLCLVTPYVTGPLASRAGEHAGRVLRTSPSLLWAEGRLVRGHDLQCWGGEQRPGSGCQWPGQGSMTPRPFPACLPTSVLKSTLQPIPSWYLFIFRPSWRPLHFQKTASNFFFLSPSLSLRNHGCAVL